jgi:glutamate/tyrosine decarboxylase-like PLP-dependent enzyme
VHLFVEFNFFVSVYFLRSCFFLLLLLFLLLSISGGLIASAWATLLSVGDDGYRRNAETIHRSFQLLKTLIAETEGLRIVGDPGSVRIKR